MLTQSPVTTMLPVKDMERAKRFYGAVLGLEPKGSTAGGEFLFGAAGGATLGLILKEGGTRAEHTAVSFEVKDIRKTMAGLKERGVVFADYDLPGLKTVQQVCVLGAEKAAWFNDPEGNILCVHQTG